MVGGKELWAFFKEFAALLKKETMSVMLALSLMWGGWGWFGRGKTEEKGDMKEEKLNAEIQRHINGRIHALEQRNEISDKLLITTEELEKAQKIILRYKRQLGDTL